MNVKTVDRIKEAGDEIFGFLYSTVPGWMLAFGITLGVILT